MGRVDLHHVKTRGDRPLRRVSEGFDQRCDLIGDQCVRYRVALEGERTRCNGPPSTLRFRSHEVIVPRCQCGSLATGVRELDAHVGPLGMGEVRNTAPRLDLFVVPKSWTLRRDASFSDDAGRLGEDQARTAGGERPQVDLMPRAWHPVDRGVLAHGAHPRAIGEVETSKS